MERHRAINDGLSSVSSTALDGLRRAKCVWFVRVWEAATQMAWNMESVHQGKMNVDQNTSTLRRALKSQAHLRSWCTRESATLVIKSDFFSFVPTRASTNRVKMAVDEFFSLLSAIWGSPTPFCRMKREFFTSNTQLSALRAAYARS